MTTSPLSITQNQKDRNDTASLEAVQVLRYGAVVGATPAISAIFGTPQPTDAQILGLVNMARAIAVGVDRLASQQVGVTPIKGVVMADLSGSDITAYFDGTGLGIVGQPWENWALCNGNNGTRNLTGKFLRLSTAAAGGVGGADSSAHTHAVDHDHGSFTSGSEAAHTHAVDPGSFTSGDEAAHTHAVDHDHGVFNSAGEGAHTHAVDHTHGLGNDFTPGVSKSLSLSFSGTSGVGSAHVHAVNPPAFTGASGVGSSHAHAVDVPSTTSGVGSSHTHDVDTPAFTGTSGAASATDNKPAYTEMVPVMRIA
jgi:hypothetical protein